MARQFTGLNPIEIIWDHFDKELKNNETNEC